MRNSIWVFGAIGLAACGAKHTGFASGNGAVDPTTDAGDDATLAIGSSSSSGAGLNLSSSGGAANGSAGACKGGFYLGSFGGLYSSHITLFGINIPVTGDVQLTLEQQGTAQMTCSFQGESEQCSNVFSLKNGIITGVADAVHTGDATVGGFPYYCTMTGTLGCKQKKLVNGWIECTYCIGPLADGGLSCALLDGVGGTTGVGGHFAGPLTADYFYGSGDGGGGPPSFGTDPPPAGNDPGAWNGAEALAGYSGTGPLPDGGTLADYLSDAGYGRIGASNDFGGYGWWNATYQHP